MRMPDQFWLRSISHVTTFAVLLFNANPYICRADDDLPLRQFTGAHTRVVWLQDHGTAANDSLAAGTKLRLMKFDSDDQKGETPLLAELRNYAKPLLTPDGQRVVYSDQIAQKVFVINWDGTGRKSLSDGFAVDVCRDPGDGTDWVYVAKRIGKPDVAVYRNVRRIRLDDPKVSQKVWDQTDISCDNFQISADGTRAGSDFPWPHGGVADLTKKTWKKLDQGCWASLAPDNSGLSWVLDGPHRNLQFRRPDQSNGWKVEISGAPNVKGAEVFHPRWSNHVRYLSLTGPYQIRGAVNLISGGGPQVEIQLGRFSPNYQSIESWHQLTHNDFPDFYPDLWIEGGENSAIELPGLKNPSLEITAEWPVNTPALFFAWSNSAATNQLGEQTARPGHSCKVTPHGSAVFGRFFDMRLMGGTFQLDEVEQPLLKALHGTQGLTLEMLVTPDIQPATMAAFCEFGAAGQPTFQISQKGAEVHWKIGADQGKIEVPTWKTVTGEPSSTVHVGVTLSAKKLEVWLDGKSSGSFPLTAALSAGKSAELRLGSTGWRGRIEAFAAHERILSADEMSREAKYSRVRLGSRKSIPRVRLQVKNIEPSSIPKPEQILPYRRALAVDRCEVVKVLEPTSGAVGLGLKPGVQILVARWVILDGQPLPNAVLKSGSTAAFTLERLSEHRELESERQIIDTIEVDLPMWYAVE